MDSFLLRYNLPKLIQEIDKMNIPAPIKEIEFTAASLPQRNFKPRWHH